MAPTLMDEQEWAERDCGGRIRNGERPQCVTRVRGCVRRAYTFRLIYRGVPLETRWCHLLRECITRCIALVPALFS